MRIDAEKKLWLAIMMLALAVGISTTGNIRQDWQIEELQKICVQEAK